VLYKRIGPNKGIDGKRQSAKFVVWPEDTKQQQQQNDSIAYAPIEAPARKYREHRERREGRRGAHVCTQLTDAQLRERMGPG